MVEDFFKQAITNNTGSDNIGLSNWYINNLGGFCVINDEKVMARHKVKVETQSQRLMKSINLFMNI